MSIKIQLKRGVKTNLPVLDIGEPAFTTDEGELYIGSSTGNEKLSSKSEINSINEQLADNAYSVKLFGAKGDGVTDDTNSIQNAINQAVALNAGVFFPKGIYKITHKITLQSNSSLIGDRAIIKSDDNLPNTEASATMFWLDSASNIKITNLEFDGNKVNQPTADDPVFCYRFMHIDNCDNITINNCYFHDFKHPVIHVKALIPSDPTSKGVYNFFVTNNRFIDNWSAVTITDSDSKYILFANNYVYNCQEHGFTAYPGNSYVTVTGNIIKNCGLRTMGQAPGNGLYNYGSCIRLLEAVKGVVSNNIVENPRVAGIRITSNDTLVYQRTKHVTVTGNVVLGGDRLGDQGNGIEIGADNCTVTGNVVKDFANLTTTTGIYVDGDNNLIANNEIVNTSQAGVSILGNCNNVNGNVIVDSGTYGIMLGGSKTANKIAVNGNNIRSDQKTMDRGIYVQSNATELSINGNLFKNVTANLVNFGGQILFVDGAYFSNAAPTSGTYVKGDRVFNTSPTRAKNISHWVCITGNSTGGVWMAVGQGYGTTAERPTMGVMDQGYSYFDSTLAKVITWNGSTWLV